MTLKPFFQQRIEQEELRRKAANMTRQEMFDHGFLTTEDLDDEELRYGRCRDQNGRIPKVSNKTQTIPRDLFDEMVAEHERRTDQKLRQQLDVMLDVMVSVATDDTVEPRDRLEAAKYLFERVAGKTPEKVSVTVQKAPWEELMGGIAQLSRAESRARREGTIDAEVVEEPEANPMPWEAQNEWQATGRTDLEPQSDGRDGVGEQSRAWGDESNLALRHHAFEHSAFAPAEQVPTHDNPANSSVTMLAHETGAPDEIAKMIQAQKDLVDRRKAARDRIQNAKKQRKIKRATGADVWQNKQIGFDIADDGKATFNLGSEQNGDSVAGNGELG